MTQVFEVAKDLLVVLAAIGTLITLWTAWIVWDDWKRSKNLVSLPEFPLSIRRSIPFRQYVLALDRFEQLLKDSRWHPDVVVGIHYGGIASAADVARRFYKPVCRVGVRFDDSDGAPSCNRVWLECDRSWVDGKDVLLVDNRVHSGKTMDMAKELLQSMGAKSVRTLVVFRLGSRSYEPTYLLFSGKGNLRHLLR